MDYIPTYPFISPFPSVSTMYLALLIIFHFVTTVTTFPFACHPCIFHFILITQTRFRLRTPFSSIVISTAVLARRAVIKRASHIYALNYAYLLRFSYTSFSTPLFRAYISVSMPTTPFCPLSVPYPYFPSLHFPNYLPLSSYKPHIIHNLRTVIYTSFQKASLS